MRDVIFYEFTWSETYHILLWWDNFHVRAADSGLNAMFPQVQETASSSTFQGRQRKGRIQRKIDKLKRDQPGGGPFSIKKNKSAGSCQKATQRIQFWLKKRYVYRWQTYSINWSDQFLKIKQQQQLLFDAHMNCVCHLFYSFFVKLLLMGYWVVAFANWWDKWFQLSDCPADIYLDCEQGKKANRAPGQLNL